MNYYVVIFTIVLGNPPWATFYEQQAKPYATVCECQIAGAKRLADLVVMAPIPPGKGRAATCVQM